MRINVVVQKICEYNGISYDSVVITEDDIRKLAEEKARDKIYSPNEISFVAQEIETTHD